MWLAMTTTLVTVLHRSMAPGNGVVTVIGKNNEKRIDYMVFSKNCNGCKMLEKQKNDINYVSLNIKLEKKCQLNHTSSSGSMESTGTVTMFNRSVEINKLRYIEYVGDGDTSSFKDVKDSNPYQNEISIVKRECIGHVQKRMGMRLRNLVKFKKKEILPGLTRKGIDGKGRLSEKNINILQNYYGMAIRQNTTNLYEMKKAIGATLFHCSDLRRRSSSSVLSTMNTQLV